LNESNNLYVKVGAAVHIPCKGGGLGQGGFSRSYVTGLKLTYCSSICDPVSCVGPCTSLIALTLFTYLCVRKARYKNSSGSKPSRIRTRAILITL
jgi:hypothetical protein